MSDAHARSALIYPEFLDDLRYWVHHDRKVAERVLGLVEDITRDPFRGRGKPEPLRHSMAGTWSRRITEQHRLVYRVHDDRIDFLQARYHYRP